MKKDSVIDYLSYILFRVFSSLFRLLPINIALCLGSFLGELAYLLDLKHRAIAYNNIKQATGGELLPCQLSRLTRDFYRSFGMNLIEMFFLPRLDREHIKKYITIENQHYINEAFQRGKGIIFLGVHEGSWEISNILCANLGFSFSLFIRNQRLPRLNNLLNSYRRQKGCRIIQRQEGTRELIRELKKNHAIGMNLDQGGKSGMLVDFFGKSASMPTGAIRLALKYDATIIPAFYKRIRGPYVKVTLGEPLKIEKTGNINEDISINVKKAVRIFERYILLAPREYLWSYKIWKYSRQRNILILSDAKAGHLRQSQAMARMITASFKDRGLNAVIETREVKFKSRLSKAALLLSSFFSGRYTCQGCLLCLKYFLTKESYKSLIGLRPDIVISCGSSLAALNLILARDNLARSVVIMRPSLLGTKKFSLIAWPRHDRPPRRKNVVATEGALNLVDQEYLVSCAKNILTQTKIEKNFVLGFLLGGDTKDSHLDANMLKETIRKIKGAIEKLGGEILVSTSRRTPAVIERIVKDEFLGFAPCRFLVIANEKNHPDAVGAILALSKIVVASSESISMVSEAASSGRYVVVFNTGLLNKRHRLFIEHLSKAGYIYTSDADNLGKVIEDIWKNKPAVKTLQDNQRIREAVETRL